MKKLFTMKLIIAVFAMLFMALNVFSQTPPTTMIGAVVVDVQFLAGDVKDDNALTSADAAAIQNNFISNKPFARTPWSFWKA